ncbi:MAG: ribA/ribD-fused uncharacterized protein [Pirellulaceae bacterium]|jgi:ribA/ribD-fused uncharacterized protein
MWISQIEKMSERAIIKFYSVADEYGCFPNFALYPIRLKLKSWPTSEHYFQAQKFSDPKLQSMVRRAGNPMAAARIGRSRKNPIRRNWMSMRVNVMRDAVRAKFTQHLDLHLILLDTNDALIVEDAANDAFWGVGGDGRGQNMLGRLLVGQLTRFWASS